MPPKEVPNLISGQSNLLFLFIGAEKMIGSYFPTQYVSMKELPIRAPGSLIFIHEPGSRAEVYFKFRAVESAEYHLQMNERSVISQGNRPTSGDGVRSRGSDLSYINYYLPTDSYAREEQAECPDPYPSHSGSIRIKQMLIYQLKFDE
jgi:hypothetical protein